MTTHTKKTKRILLLGIFFLFVDILSVFSFGCQGRHSHEKPCLIIIGLDAVQAKYTGFGSDYKSLNTPCLDAVSRNSYILTNTYSSASWTLPSFMTWFTSLYPSKHGVTNKFIPSGDSPGRTTSLDYTCPGAVTLAEILKSRGYKTAAFTGDAGLGAEYGFARGFDIYSETEAFGSFRETIPPALKWLNKVSNEKFFLFIHGYDAHGKAALPKGFSNPFNYEEYKGSFSGTPEEFLELRNKGFFIDDIQMKDEDIRRWRIWYRNKIHSLDESLCDFFQHLKEMGIMDRAVILIAADHGTEMHEHGRFDHGFTLYNELIHVPAMLKVPGSKGGRITELVRTVDFTPTLLDLLHESHGAEWAFFQGVSIIPLLEGRPMKLDAFSETDYLFTCMKRALITSSGWKIILDLNSHEIELYNLNDDPDETRNLANVENAKAYSMERRLYNFMGY